MASKVNNAYTYTNLVNGYTVWERLRMTRNFLEDRLVAKANVENAAKYKEESMLLRIKAAEAKIAEAEKESEKLAAMAELAARKAEYEEYKAHLAQLDDGIQHLNEEIEFLQKLEKELAEEAEKTRIPGYTDHQMYEYNAPYEVYVRNIKAIEEAHIANVLGLPRDVVTEAMRVPPLAKRLSATAELPYVKQSIAQISNELNNPNLTDEQRNALLENLNSLVEKANELEKLRIDPSEGSRILSAPVLMRLNEKLFGLSNDPIEFVKGSTTLAIANADKPLLEK